MRDGITELANVVKVIFDLLEVKELITDIQNSQIKDRLTMGKIEDTAEDIKIILNLQRRY